MHCGASPKHLPISLFLIRASVVLMAASWVADKFINPAHMVGIAESFYGITGRGATLVLIIGVAQMVLLVCFALGIARTWSYGLTLLMHGVSTFSRLGSSTSTLIPVQTCCSSPPGRCSPRWSRCSCCANTTRCSACRERPPPRRVIRHGALWLARKQRKAGGSWLERPV